MKKEVTLN